MALKSFREVIEETLSLRYHDSLNPALFDETDHLKPAVRQKLLMYAAAFREFAEVPVDAVVDVIMVGGNANYNYTSLSDIDVHIVADFAKIGLDKVALDSYFRYKKSEFSTKKTYKVGKYPLEPYVQDSTEQMPIGQGVYSLMRDEWLNHPVNLHLNYDNDVYLTHKIDAWKHRIDYMLSSFATPHQIEKIKDRLREMRSSGLERGGEFSPENLTFKELRNSGYLARIDAYMRLISNP